MNDFTNNLIFSLNASVPIFLMMVLGWVLRKTNILDDNSSMRLSKLSFQLLLPALLFVDLSNADFISIWDTKFVLFCTFATIISISISALLSLLHKDHAERGEIIQASYRSSAAILGIAFVNNIYGNAEMAALMIIGTVPIYNIIAVAVLSITSPDRDKNGSKKALILRTVKNTLKNPIIIGIAAGILWSLLRIPQPKIMSKFLSYISGMASPLSLIALGALFKIDDARSRMKISAFVTFIKLILFCALFLPVAAWLGFRNEKLVAVLVMLGSSTTASSFVMATNMGHKGVVTSCTVMLTTFFSSFTLTLWLLIMKSLNYI